MVRIITENQQEFEKERVTPSLFLSSLKSWYTETGVKCGVEKVSKIFKKQGEKPQVAVHLTILDEMAKCRARIINDDGFVEMEEDERTGKEVPKIEIIKNPEEVTFFFKLNEIEEMQDETEEKEYMIHNMASGFPLLNAGFISNGLIPENNQQSFAFTHTELVESLMGLEFTGFVEEREYQGKYNVLIPHVQD